MAKLSDDPATHNLADDKNTPILDDNPAAHDIADDKSRGFISDDRTTGTAAPGSSHAYTGPVQGLQNEYIGVTDHPLNITVTTDNWFIHSGSGDDGIAAHGGTNVLDGGTGSTL